MSSSTSLLARTFFTVPVTLIWPPSVSARRLKEPISSQPWYAGHSMGEFTAAVAEGCLSFEDGLRLVRELRTPHVRGGRPAAWGHGRDIRAG